eukprot:389479_1
MTMKRSLPFTDKRSKKKRKLHETSYAWQWEESSNDWKMYSPQQCAEITRCEVGSQISFTVDAWSYHIWKTSKDSAVQINTTTLTTRPVRRTRGMLPHTFIGTP